MTDRVALYLAVLLVLLAGLDLLFNGSQILIFLAQKFLDTVDWIQFWR